MERLWQDLRYGVRMLAKSPGFTAVAILSLALGIGANTAIFSVVDAVLFEALPYDEPMRLIRIWETFPGPDGGSWRGSVSVPNLDDWRSQNTVFEAIGAASFRGFNLTGSAGPVRVQGASVTPEVFSLLGVEPALGRFLGPGDDQPGSHQVIVLGHGLWQSHFGADPEVVGRTTSVGGENHTIVGVMPPGFTYPPRSSNRLWAPLVFSEMAQGDRGMHWYNALARLKDGVSLAAAEAEIKTIAARLAEEYPDSQEDRSVRLLSLPETVVRRVRPILYSLWGVVGFVLLIGCGNVANLLLARATGRRREFAMRTALGASRWQLVRQVLVESVLLAAAGGAVGLLFGRAVTGWLAGLPGSSLPPGHEVAIDLRVVAYCALASLAAAALSGLVPALRVSRTTLREAMAEGGDRGATRRDPIRGALLVAEVALALVVLIGSSLLGKSLLRLQSVDPGFDATGVLTMQISLPESRYDSAEASVAFFEDLLGRLREIPGVETAGAIDLLPIQNWGHNGNFTIAGFEPASIAEAPFAENRRVAGDYFRSLSIPVVAGRGFDARDRTDSAPVVVVNETLTRRYWSGPAEAVGQRFTWSDEPSAEDWFEVVGVVGDVRNAGLDQTVRSELYLSLAQSSSRQMSLVVQAKDGDESLAGAVRREVWALDPEQPIQLLRSMDEVVARFFSGWRFNAVLFSSFAALALVLAMAGVYGVLSYDVSQRTPEIGLRMALGAQHRDVLRLITWQGFKLAVIGAALGVAASLVLATYLRSLLYSVEPTDPASFATVTLLLLAVALIACLIPARRATRVEPTVALRYE